MLVGDFHAGDHGVDAPGVEGGEGGAGAFEELVAGVFHVVLVIGVVDHALEVALVVPHFHFDFVDVLRHGWVIVLRVR